MSTPSRGERCATGRLAVAVCRSCAFSDVWRWQDIDAMHSQAPGDGRICAKCVLGRLVVARLCLDAFPGARRWQDCALMRSWPDWQWQYSRAVRSRAPIRGNVSPQCVPGRQPMASFALHASRKWPRTGESPIRGKIRAPCIRNELALARYARHASEKPRKPPLEDTPREYLARKGPFSLHAPPESCIVRRSCHRSAHERKGSGRKCLRFVKTEPKRQKMSPKVLTSF